MIESVRSIRRESGLQGGVQGVPPFFAVDGGRTWVAITQTAGGGAGWFACSRDLDPEWSDWESVDPLAVLVHAGADEERVAALMAAMISTCLADGFGQEALRLADALLERGFEIEVAARAH